MRDKRFVKLERRSILSIDLRTYLPNVGPTPTYVLEKIRIVRRNVSPLRRFDREISTFSSGSCVRVRVRRLQSCTQFWVNRAAT